MMVIVVIVDLPFKDKYDNKSPGLSELAIMSEEQSINHVIVKDFGTFFRELISGYTLSAE